MLIDAAVIYSSLLRVVLVTFCFYQGMQLDSILNISEAVTSLNSARAACQAQSQIALSLQLNEKEVLGHKLVVILHPIILS